MGSALLFLQCNSVKKYSMENDSDILYDEGVIPSNAPPDA